MKTLSFLSVSPLRGEFSAEVASLEQGCGLPSASVLALGSESVELSSGFLVGQKALCFLAERHVSSHTVVTAGLSQTEGILKQISCPQ